MYEVPIHTTLYGRYAETSAIVDEDNEVLVYDEVAKHFTTCHRLTHEQKEKIRELAAAGERGERPDMLYIAKPFG